MALNKTLQFRSLTPNMQTMIPRLQEKKIFQSLKSYPAVALLGARQVGKTTLAKSIAKRFDRKAIYLDLENPADLVKLQDPLFFLREHQDHLVLLDEIQRKPELFPVLRSLIDEKRNSGRFLLLGSASPLLLKQSSESLAGRIRYHELDPLNLFEVGAEAKEVDRLWLRGGFPDSYSQKNTPQSFDWMDSFIRTFLERDLNQLGFRIPSQTMRRFWIMLAHHQACLLNSSSLAQSLEVTDKTIKHWTDVLVDTFMIRRLMAWSGNQSKRLVKSPKIYIRDSGLLHSLLKIETKESLLSHPVLGASWEGFVIEQIAQGAPERSELFFYRTSTGEEIDLIVQLPNQKKWVFEIKRSSIPTLSRGFYNALEDISPDKAFVIHAGKDHYRINSSIEALPISQLDKTVREMGK